MRIDSFLVKNNYFASREKAVNAIKKGQVLYNDKPVKPSFDVVDGSLIKIYSDGQSFVSQGGYKLEKALLDFNFSVKDKKCRMQSSELRKLFSLALKK